MKGIKVKILGIVNDSPHHSTYPGWLRCTFTDIHGKEWFVVEKIPIIYGSDEFIDENTAYPVDGILPGLIEKVSFDDNNREIITVLTGFARDNEIEAEDGSFIFEVYKDQVVE